MATIREPAQPAMDQGEGMNLGEALAAKAKNQGIKTMAVMPDRKQNLTGGKTRNATDEEILEMWKKGYSRYAIAKRLCRCSIKRVRRIVEEYEAGKVQA